MRISEIGWVGLAQHWYFIHWILSLMCWPWDDWKGFSFSLSRSIFLRRPKKERTFSLSLRSLTLISLVPTYLHTYVCSMINKEKSSDGKRSVFGLPFKTFFNRKGSSSKFGFKTSRQLTKVRKLENTKLYFCQIRYQPTNIARRLFLYFSYLWFLKIVLRWDLHLAIARKVIF